MTHAAHNHAALERRDAFDSLTRVADLAIEASKMAKTLEAELAEAKLVLAMADAILRHGKWHPSMQNQVAGVRSQIRGVIK